MAKKKKIEVVSQLQGLCVNCKITQVVMRLHRDGNVSINYQPSNSSVEFSIMDGDGSSVSVDLGREDIQRIICLLELYKNHADEMGDEVDYAGNYGTR